MGQLEDWRKDNYAKIGLNLHSQLHILQPS